MANLKDLSLQNNMPGMDFRGKRPDMGRNQAGMQQIEVGTSSVSCILSWVTNYCLILAQNFRVLFIIVISLVKLQNCYAKIPYVSAPIWH